jgi:branched-chain amino acid aminotransferase
MWIYLNDGFVQKADARISVFDHGFLYGDGIYETLRTYRGRLFMLQPHLARLKRSARLIGLELPVADKDWPALLEDTLSRNGLGPSGNADAHLRITVSRGEGELGLDPALCKRPTVVIMAKPLTIYPARLFAEGVSLAIVPIRRNLDAALSPQIKSLNFLNNILAKQQATQAGAFDALMLNAGGQVAECTTSNIFFVRDGRLCTPAVECGILDGITRDVVLRLAREQSIPTEEGRYGADSLWQAQEGFITNTSMEIMPVCRIDGRPVGDGRPGPVTTKLRQLFQANVGRFLA